MGESDDEQPPEVLAAVEKPATPVDAAEMMEPAVEPEEPVLVAAAEAEGAEEAEEAEPESPVVVPQPEKQQPQGMSEDDAEAARMMAETNAMIHQCVPRPKVWPVICSQFYPPDFCSVMFCTAGRFVRTWSITWQRILKVH